MARPVKRHLKIGATPHLDENELFVRMHDDDIPKGVVWGRYIHVSTNNKRISCRVLSNAMAEIKAPRAHQISINKHLRDILEVKQGTNANFYVSKASRLKVPYYKIRYHPDAVVRRRVLLKTFGIIVLVLIVITIVSLYFSMWA